MTEEKWLASSDPIVMIDEMDGRVSTRKLRLFAVACCRRIWEVLDDNSKNAICVAEKYADGLASIGELRSVLVAILQRTGGGEVTNCGLRAVHASLYDPLLSEYYLSQRGIMNSGVMAPYAESAIDSPWAFSKYPSIHVAYAKAALAASVRGEAARLSAVQEEYEEQCLILHDIVGNPFHAISITPSWLTHDGGVVVRLANDLYQQRAGSKYKMLAEALTRAGCDSGDILAHCSSEKPHFRGCWLIDRLLGKT